MENLEKKAKFLKCYGFYDRKSLHTENSLLSRDCDKYTTEFFNLTDDDKKKRKNNFAIGDDNVAKVSKSIRSMSLMSL